MAKNYVQDGASIVLAAPYDRNAGDGAQVGSLFGVSLGSVLSGASGVFATEGVWDLTALSTASGSQGDKAYWDNTNKRVDTVSTVGLLIGVLAVAKTNGQTTARVKLNEAAQAESPGAQTAIANVTTADATDLATAIALTNVNKAKINALLAELRTMGILLP